jgi:hypothetical protein
MEKRYIVIVDSWSTGINYPPEILALKQNDPAWANVEIIHVQSQTNVPDVFKGQHASLINKNIFSQYIIHESVEKTLAALPSKEKIWFLMPGTECGVNVADELSHALGLESSNGIALSEARRNKYLMHETLRAAGVNAVTHCQSDTVEDIIAFANTLPRFVAGEEPVVLKPVDDAATNNVKFCKDEQSIRDAFTLIKSSKNTFGHQNEVVLAQEFIDGDEYIVNATARRMPPDASGYRELVIDFGDIWLEVKKPMKDASGNISLVYDREELISPADPRHKLLSDYVRSSSLALGVNNGPIHAEVKITKSKGVKLIEQAARMPGGIDLDAYNEALGYNPVGISLKAYSNPAAFKAFANAPKEDKLQGRIIWNVFGISDISGTVHQEIDVDALTKALPTLFVKNGKPAFHNNLDVGGELKRTLNMLTDPYYFYLIGTPEDVKRDYEKFRAMEPALLNKIATPKPQVANHPSATFTGGTDMQPAHPSLHKGRSLAN